MAQAVSTITRRGAVAGLALAAAPVGLLAGTDRADAQAKQVSPKKVCTSGWAVSSPSQLW